MSDLAVPFKEWTVYGRWWPTLRRRGAADAVVIHHSVTHVLGKSGVDQARGVERAIWGRRWTSGFSMIAYSWVCSTRARIFEGRGERYRNGANRNTKGTAFNNGNTVSICLAGNYHDGVAGFVTNVPTDAQARAVAKLIVDLIGRGTVKWEARAIPHRHMHSTACPGSNVVGQWIDSVNAYVDLFLASPSTPDDEEGLPAMFDVQRDSEVNKTWATWTVGGDTKVRWYANDRPDAVDKPGGAWIIHERGLAVNPGESPYS